MASPDARGQGRFITFEGIDGAGKSTQIEAAAAWLRAQGAVVACTREPGGTPLAEQLRAAFLEQPMDALTEALLVFAARRDHLVGRIRPALAAGQVVLCDRFTDATFAYQGAGRGFRADVLEQLEHWVHEGLQPDLTLWFDVDASTAAARRAGARVADRLEAESAAFFERVRAGYLERCKGAPGRFVRIDAAAGPDDVWAQVRSALDERMQP